MRIPTKRDLRPGVNGLEDRCLLSGNSYPTSLTITPSVIEMRAPADFDGDGKTDLIVFQPATSTFLIRPSTDPSQPLSVQFGQGTENGGDPIPLVGDFDGDGKPDLAVFQPGTSTFFVSPSSGGKPYAVQFGQGKQNGGDPIPLVGDFDGDGTIDLAVFQPSNSTFYIRPSTDPGQPLADQFGQGTANGGDPIPLVGDFDGDGKTDLAVFQPSNSTFYVRPSTDPIQPLADQFGQGTENGGDPIPLVGDFDGDGKTDLAVFQTADSTLFVRPSTDPIQPLAVQFGTGKENGGDPILLVGDFDGDGKPDLAVFQPDNSVFFVSPSSGLEPYAVQFGLGTENGGDPIPLPVANP